MTYPENFVSLAMGHRNSVGDWIVDDYVEVLAIATSCPQIIITPSAHPGPSLYNLSHLQSGFFLLGGFRTIDDAREAATRLAKLFPIADWDALGQISQSWRRRVVRNEWNALSLEDKLWMYQHGGPKL